MKVSVDDDFTPEWRDDGSTTSTGHITLSENDRATMRFLISLVEEEGATDVHLVFGPLATAGVDQRTSVVLRSASGLAFLRLARRALYVLEKRKELDG